MSNDAQGKAKVLKRPSGKLLGGALILTGAAIGGWRFLTEETNDDGSFLPPYRTGYESFADANRPPRPTRIEQIISSIRQRYALYNAQTEWVNEVPSIKALEASGALDALDLWSWLRWPFALIGAAVLRFGEEIVELGSTEETSISPLATYWRHFMHLLRELH